MGLRPRLAFEEDRRFPFPPSSKPSPSPTPESEESLPYQEPVPTFSATSVLPCFVLALLWLLPYLPRPRQARTGSRSCPGSPFFANLDTTRAAAQLRSFIGTGHAYGDLVCSTTLDYLGRTESPVPSPRRGPPKTRASELTELSESDFPSDWVIDKPSFRKDLTAFERQLNLPTSFTTKEKRYQATVSDSSEVSTLGEESEVVPRSEYEAEPSPLSSESPYQSTERPHHQPTLYAQGQTFEIDPFPSSRLFTQPPPDEQEPATMASGTGRGSGSGAAGPSQNQRQTNNPGGPGSGQSDSGVSGVTPAPNFTAGQRQELMDIIAAAIRMSQRPQGPPDSSPPPDSGPGPAQGQDPNWIKPWTPEEIGFFDPDGEDEAAVSTVGRHVFYRDIYVFVDRLKDMAPLRGEDKLRIVIPQCLRGSAIVWHTTELSEMEKGFLRTATVAQWESALLHRFKERAPVALAKLQSIRYSMADAKAGKDPRSFAQDIFRHAKAAHLDSVQNQLTMAWNALDCEFRFQIPEPTATSTIRQFLHDLDSHAGIWHEIARKRSYNPGSTSSSKKTTYSKQSTQSSRWETKNRDPSRIVADFMNLLSTTGQTKYSPTYHDQDSKQDRQGKSDSGRASDTKAITGSSSKVRLQITSGNESDSKKGKKPFKTKSHAYMADDDEEEVDYYEPSNEEDQLESEANHGDQDSSSDQSEEGPFVGLTDPVMSSPSKSAQCKKCKTAFPSNNKLHTHIRDKCPGRPRQDINLATQGAATGSETESEAPGTELPILSSKVDPSQELGTGFGFRGYQYAMASLSLTKDGPGRPGCLDTGAGLTIMDKGFFLSQSKEPIRTMATEITVRGIGSDKHRTKEYVISPIFFQGTNERGQQVKACFRREIHLVSDLKANVLIGTDILTPENFILDFKKGVAVIGSCSVTIPITTRRHSKPVDQVVCLKESVTIPAQSQVQVRIHHLNLPEGRDFLFEPGDANFGLYAHVMGSETAGVLVRNDEDKPIKVPRNFRLGRVTEMEYPNAYLATSDTMDLAVKKSEQSHQKAYLQKLLRACLSDESQSDPVPEDKTVKTKEGITIHNADPAFTRRLTELIRDYSIIWTDQGFASLPQNEWMRIPLKENSETRSPTKTAVYPLGARDRDLVDQTFDELHRKGRLQWTTQGTPWSYPCFVVWKTGPDGIKKGRVVVDVRRLNSMTIPDVYPLPLQSDIIAAVRDCPYISVIDCAGFFYQWRVHPSDRHKLTVISHRGQESFNVAVMGYRNSPAYVQRQIDRLLRPCRAFARAYIDDVVIFSKNQQEHLDHLKAVFETFQKFNISIKPSKTFLAYPSVRLLGQKVNSLGLVTDEDKLRAISKLKFPTTLRQLEHYLGLTGWLREYVKSYAKVSEPLQDRKTALLKRSPIAGSARRSFSARTLLQNPTEEEVLSYKVLQKRLSSPRYLVHCSPVRQLYLDVDASKEEGIGAMVYHSKQITSDYPARTMVEPIMFLSRRITDTESRYWPTELELAGLVWVLRKTRHMIESAQQPPIIYTDHGAAVGISRQESLSTSSTDKLNLRLIRASEYIQRFNIIIRHKPGKNHVVPDALSRLATESDPDPGPEEGELDALSATVESVFNLSSVVEISKEFRERIIEGYKKESAWVKVQDAISKAAQDGTKTAFREEDGLLYLEDGHTTSHAFQPRRLCLPQAVLKEVFQAAHSSSHLGFHRSYEILSSVYYIRGLTSNLKAFIKHCPECQVNQTRRHKPHGSLQPIESPPVPFHTVAMDFILALPTTKEGFDCAMSVTCKFSKRMTLIPGKTTWKAKDWAETLLTRLDIMDWGLPKQIISDRDRKFLSEFWKTLFSSLGVRLLYSTAYHPQTDGLSERTNQSAEIALRYHLATMDPTKWPEVLPVIQRCFNNSISSTGRTPNESVYGFTPTSPADLTKLDYVSGADQPSPHAIRQEIADAIAFSQVISKYHYDLKHKPVQLSEGSYVLLRLHRGYSIPSTEELGKKLSQQFVGPFKVLKKIGTLAYQLDIPAHWRIHPVFTIAQLEPVPNPDSDPYDRQRSRPPPVHVEGDTDTIKSYVLERIIRSRQSARGKEYLVRWKGYGPEEDAWRSLPEMGNALDLVKEYEATTSALPARRPKHSESKTPVPSQVRQPIRKRGRPRKAVQG